MRLIDADALFDVLYQAWGIEMDAGPASELMEMINNAPTIIPQPNLALTLDELREMNGEPVWIQWTNGGLKRYYIAHSTETGLDLCHDGCYHYRFDNYGQAWLAYRRKPEEVVRSERRN